ncbi:uncharacterized protein [Littorina saxatilis]|uniref:uncharacterized protein n=1 Tax=Littorina saxatilis TaxID=31220 RepID=UPI0038B68A14
MAMTFNRPSDDKTTCNVSIPLPTENGSFAYSVKLRPGSHVVYTNTIELRRPSTPSITCSPTPVPENSIVSCTCSADLGEPGGQMQWVKKNDTNRIKLSTGSSPMSLTRQLTRTDHNVTKFACEVMWSNEVKTSDNYTAVIGPPIQQSASDEDNGTSIAGGIVVAVVCVVVAAIIVFFIVRRRRKGTQTDKSDNGMQTSDHNNSNGADESHEDSCRAASGSHPHPLKSIPLCEQPGTLSAASNDRHGTGYEYAAVNKPKGNASAMISNVNPSSAEYADVNTTKKTQKPPAMNTNQAGTADEHAAVVKPKKHTLRLEASSTKPADENAAVMKKTKAKDGKPKSKPKDAMKKNRKKKGPMCGYNVDMNPTKKKTNKLSREGEYSDHFVRTSLGISAQFNVARDQRSALLRSQREAAHWRNV